MVHYLNNFTLTTIIHLILMKTLEWYPEQHTIMHSPDIDENGNSTFHMAHLSHRRVDRSGLVISFWFPRTNVNAIELRAYTIKLRAYTQVCPYKTPCI